ncbi:HNH endonuclease signature motif containing protein [Pseudomonas sp. MH10]|uniref:HNH endonuclease signature motif containing protein n=1 Tax=Pseudomonas sp. MH10 TaxID=3048627 RepID=UPI002AC8D21F|nr:HNH endonuclease signature motif containing protein [Pseudomonas sp. MH10]MEB0040420.1 HNH endonuclease signature motif containing protein [Pseudomonas sp. MH10]WPX61847.1 HNH endonuclease signature motif containing protein [Pseudomonas sp. MH10]
MEDIVTTAGFSGPVKTKLRQSVGNYCSAPFCGIQTNSFNPETGCEKHFSEAAHIYGLRPGSARYDDLPAGTDRNAFENGISLCPTCHRMIDRSPELFPGRQLTTWKRNAEYQHNLSSRSRHNTSQQGSYNLTEEIKTAELLIASFQPLRQFMEHVCWSGLARNSLTSIAEVPEDVLECIRLASSGRLRQLSGSLYLFQHNQFNAWFWEVVRGSREVKSMPEFSSVTGLTNDVDFHHDFDDGDLMFKHPAARAIHGLKQQIDRFQDFVARFERQPSSVRY